MLGHKSCIIRGSDKKRSNASCRGLGGLLLRQFPEIVSLTHFSPKTMNKSLVLAAIIAAAALAACGKKEEAPAPAPAPAADASAPAAAPAADASAPAAK